MYHSPLNPFTMRPICKLLLLSATFILVTTFLAAQEQQTSKSKNPRWISDKGFWQIESNIHTPGKNIISFYNNDKVMVYKEHLNGVVLNLNKRNVKMRLKKALETAVLAWNQDRIIQYDQQWISSLFKK